MNTGVFITKQHAKYYLKVLGRRQRDDVTDARGAVTDEFWQYEQTPRAISA